MQKAVPTTAEMYMRRARHEIHAPKAGGANTVRWRTSYVGLDLEGLEGLAREEVFGLEAALGEALLVVVAQEGVEHVAVGVEAVGPPVLARFAARFFDVCDEPGHHRGQRGGLAIHFHRALFRGGERLV